MKKTTFILILFAAITLVTAHYFLHPPVKQPSQTKVVKGITAPTIQAAVTKAENQFDEKLKLIALKNDALVQQVYQSDLLLNENELQVKKLQHRITAILSKDTTVNTSTRLENCDSLKIFCTDLIIQGQIQDSLCEQNRHELYQIISNKDSLLNYEELKYGMLKNEFNLSIRQQTVLEKDNRYLFKQVRRKTFSNRILSAGMFVVSGIAAAYFIQTKI